MEKHLPSLNLGHETIHRVRLSRIGPVYIIIYMRSGKNKINTTEYWNKEFKQNEELESNMDFGKKHYALTIFSTSCFHRPPESGTVTLKKLFLMKVVMEKIYKRTLYNIYKNK